VIVDLYIPCYVDQYQPEIARNTLKLLQKVGCGVNYNIEQTCCGQPAFEDGFRDACKEVGEKLIREFQDERYIVCPGPGCVKTIRNYYPALFHNSAMHNEYKLVQKNFFELSDFLVSVMNASDIGAVYKAKAVVHDSCTLPGDQAKESAQLTLLRKVKDLEIVEPLDAWPGCGMGGGLDRKNEALTVGMAEEFFKSISTSGADTIITNDPLCSMHLQGVIEKKNLPYKVIHLANILSSGWE
jgi:L-lactate dehydrogenase complex protein LldE